MARANKNNPIRRAKFWTLYDRPTPLIQDWYYSHRPSQGLVAEFFIAIKEIILLKKLSNQGQFANGEELKEFMAPGRGSYAIYWLNSNREPLKVLIDLGLISHSVRNEAPYGYGDDEEYRLTEDGLELIQLGKTNRSISSMINQATGAMHSYW